MKGMGSSNIKIYYKATKLKPMNRHQWNYE